MIVWVTVALLVVCGVFGWRAGLVRRLIELAGLLVSIVVASRFSSAIAPWLDAHSAMDATTALLASYVLVFVAALVAVRLLAKGLAKLVHWTPLGWVDRVGGALCAVIMGALLLSVGLIGASLAPHGAVVRETFTRHPVGNVIYHAAPAVYQGARQVFGAQVDELWHRVVEIGDRVIDEAGAS